MSQPLKMLDALLRNAAAEPPAFPPESRYHGLDTAVFTRPDGRAVAYLRRRFVPQPDRFATLAEHRVTEGERVDQLAARYFGDAELAWRLADANGVLRPAELEAVGRRLRVTLPEGVPGPAGA